MCRDSLLRPPLNAIALRVAQAAGTIISAPILLSVAGGTLAISGTYLLVTFAPHSSVHITAHLVQYYMLCWQFLLYLVSGAPKALPPPMHAMRFLVCACGLLSRCSSRPLTFSSVTTVNYRITFCYSSSVKGAMTSLTFGGKDEVNGPRVHGKSSGFTQPVCFNFTRSHKRINWDWDKHSRYHSD